MKKEIIFIIVLFLALGLINIISSQNNINKIDSKILNEFEKGKTTTRVIIENKEFDNSFFSKFINYKKEFTRIVNKQNIRHNLSKNSFSAELSQEEIQDLINQGYSVDYAWPVKLYLQDSVGVINATPTWSLQESNINLTGLHETVCILDTGVNFTHPDLLNKNLTCNIDCVGQTCAEDCSISDDHGHGTHIAGIISADSGLTGVAFESNLIGVKVLNSAGGGTTDDVLAGLQWCLNNANTYNISVISMSLGCNETISGYSSYCDSPSANACGRKYFTIKINNASSQNISIVTATGNDYWTNAIAAPACIQNATRVGSSTKTDAISSFSNTWNLSMLLAPGSSINSSRWDPNGNRPACTEQGNYMTCSGTSMATPHVAGAIAIINQYLSLTSTTKTPFEIEQILNNTGKRINDTSGSKLNYSRIDLYSAIISLDNSNPIVNLFSPVNSTTSSINNQTFLCNATDLSLKNITLYIWNSTGIYNTTSATASGKYHVLTQNLTNMSYTNYSWNCLAYDEKGNSAWQGDNYTLTIVYNLMNINSPTNNSWLNTGNFNLTLNEEGVCSFSLNNQANISMNTTNNRTFYYINNSLNNTSSLDYNITFYCNDSNGNPNSSSLIYFGIDNTKPIIKLLSPLNDYSQTTSSTTLNFIFNVSDNLNISSCELIINGTSDSTTQNTSIINKSLNNTISKTISSGTYSWKINCTDNAGNENSSSYRNFVLTAPSSSSSSGGGGGGGGSVTATTTIITSNETSAQEESSKEDSKTQTQKKLISLEKDKPSLHNLKKLEAIEFNISELHTLTLKEIKNNSIDITIQSNPLNFTLFIGEEKKLNLTSLDYYDLYIKLNNISNNSANITLKQINEKIRSNINKKLLILALIFIIIIIAIIYLLIKIISKIKNETTKTISKGKKEIPKNKK